MNLCFYESLDRMPLGIAVTLEFVGPLTVAIAGTRNRLDVVWVVLAAAGIVLLAPDIGDGLDAIGVALALTAGGFWGAYILIVGPGRPRPGRPRRPVDGHDLRLGPAAAGRRRRRRRRSSRSAGPRRSASAVALLSSAIPYTVELEALRRLPERDFGVLLSLEPAVAALVGLIVLDQHLLGREIVAIALVVAASAGALSSAEAVEAPQS